MLFDCLRLVGGEDITLPVRKIDQPVVLDNQVDESLDESTVYQTLAPDCAGDLQQAAVQIREQKLHLAKALLTAIKPGNRHTTGDRDFQSQSMMNHGFNTVAMNWIDGVSGHGRVND